MKKLLFGIIATVLFGNLSFGKDKFSIDPPTNMKPGCITMSCCSLGPFSIGIWSQTNCYSLSMQKASIGFQTKEIVNELNIPEDIVLAGTFSELKNTVNILPKGKYPVVNNEIVFTPLEVSARGGCVTMSASGSLFGYGYSYSVKACFSISLNRASSLGAIVMTPTLDKVQLEQVRKNNNVIEFSTPLEISNNGVKTIIPAGKYFVNEDGNIYMQNIKIN